MSRSNPKQLNVTMTDIEATYRSIIDCVNEKRWEDLPRDMHSHFVKNGQDSTPESYAAEIKSQGGKVEIIVDALTIDRESDQRLSAAVLVRFKPAGGSNEGIGAVDRTISFMEQHFVWFAEGKVSKILILADHDDRQRQLSKPEASYKADLISHEPPPRTSGTKLSASELHEKYRAYISCINAQAMETDLHNFCSPEVVHNTKTLTINEYRLLIQEAFTAIPDITFDLPTVIADEEAQRVAARIEFTGTPVGIIAGAKPNGRSVNFCEHVTYRFEEGKVARVWSIVDWASYRAQLSERQ
ncbi:SnoaL-domain-containing protein [Hypoxylon sp. FL0890]|nr:SnoaL-domain-containing protein [Hypoxylon sp. FL0890]